MANTPPNRSRAIAERSSDDSSWKPLDVSSKQCSAMSTRQPVFRKGLRLSGVIADDKPIFLAVLGPTAGQMDGAIPRLRQVDLMPAERLTSRYRETMHLAATLTMTLNPKTPFATHPPRPTAPRQRCPEMRVGEPTIGGKDDPTTAGKPLHHVLQQLLIDGIGHTAAGVFQAFPHQRHRSSTIDDRDAHQTGGVP